ncbi:MAG: hypothetical protein RR704_00930 [Stenotrophomonas sp.]
MSDRQTPESRLHALTDPHASIVGADGSVRPIDNQPIPGWQNHAGGATRGVKEYRGDQYAGVDNSVQAAQGCRVAAGVSDGADLCTLGTADSPVHMKEADRTRAYREAMQAISIGSDLRALALRLQQEMGYPFKQIMAGICWLAGRSTPTPTPMRRLSAKTRCRYDWFLRRWVDAGYVMAVTVGGPFHGQPVRIPREGLLFPRHLYTRHDYTHLIPYPQRYTVVLSAGSELPPTWETRDLAHKAGVIRWPGQQEMERISCLATGVPHG